MPRQHSSVAARPGGAPLANGNDREIATALVAVRLAGDEALENAVAGKPDCYESGW